MTYEFLIRLRSDRPSRHFLSSTCDCILLHRIRIFCYHFEGKHYSSNPSISTLNAKWVTTPNPIQSTTSATCHGLWNWFFFKKCVKKFNLRFLCAIIDLDSASTALIMHEPLCAQASSCWLRFWFRFWITMPPLFYLPFVNHDSFAKHCNYIIHFNRCALHTLSGNANRTKNNCVQPQLSCVLHICSSAEQIAQRISIYSINSKMI